MRQVLLVVGVLAGVLSVARPTPVSAAPEILEMGDVITTPPLAVDRLPIAISSDGRYVLWAEEATRWGHARPRLTDRATGEVTDLSTYFGDDTARPAGLTDDGRFALMWVVPAVGDGSRLERLDLASGARRVIYVNVPRTTFDSIELSAAEISADGSTVGGTFRTQGGPVSLVRIDVTTRRVETAPPDAGATLESSRFTRNGRFSVFTETNASLEMVVRHDWLTGERVLVGAMPREGNAIHASASSDGRFVVWGGIVTDVETGTWVEYSTEIREGAPTPVVSDDGSKVAFATSAPLITGDHNDDSDIYVWYRDEGLYRRVTYSDRGTQIRGVRSRLVMSSDGSTLVYVPIDPSATDQYSAAWHGGPLFVVDLNSRIDAGMVDAALMASHGVVRLYRDANVESVVDAPTFSACRRSVTASLRAPALRSGENAVSISATPSGNGYWLFTDAGRVFSCGDAEHFGGLDDVALDGPIVDSTATASGNGYYMIAADGGVFAFGDAQFHGSVPQVLPGVDLAAPIVAISVTSSGSGYRMVAADGGMFNFGDAAFFGSIPQVLPTTPLRGPIVAMVSSEDGYLMVGDDGGVFNFGESVFHGSLGDEAVADPIGTVVVSDDLGGYVMFDGNGRTYAFGNGELMLR